MSIKEKKKDGKITKDNLENVLRIIEIDLNSLKGCCGRIEMQGYDRERFSQPEKKLEYPPDELLNIFSLIEEMIMHHQVLFAQNAFDFWEFFYKEEAPKEDEYYHFEFPIDLEKFKKKRVPEKELLEMMSKMDGSDEDRRNIRDLVCRNVDVFYECMKTKLKRPAYDGGKKILDHYVEKLKEAGKITDEDEKEKKNKK